LSGLDESTVADILMAAADVVLIVNSLGMIIDTCFSLKEIFACGGRAWNGRPIAEIVTPESEEKISELLEAARSGKLGAPRQVNHLMLEADDLPVNYQGVKLNAEGDVILFGRSLEQVATLQRRLMSSQLAMEREVAKLRNGENKYRAVFQLSTSPQIMVDAKSLRIVDINSQAATIFGKEPQKLENKKILSLFGDAENSALHKLLLTAINNHHDSDTKISLVNGTQVSMRVVNFQQGGSTYLLLYLKPVDTADSGVVHTIDQRVLDLVKKMPDGFVVTNSELKIITANTAFLELLNISGISDSEGAELDHFFDRQGVDCKVLMANVREHGLVRRFASAMKTRFGQVVNVEIAACQLDMGSEPMLGFWIRPTNNIIMGSKVEQEKISRSNEQIANLVGHMPLKDIVRETTEMIEHLCIETALELTQNNRASAAQMLGVSRQSLYSKLPNDKDNRKS
ncbi:MAG: transcriptional regulator PpsR, partial [Pseudomonadota bacterium]